MKPELDEVTIRELFQQLKQTDKQRSPSFGRLWAEANGRVQPETPSRLPERLVLTCTTLLALSVIFFTLRSEIEGERQTRDLIQLSSTVTQWKAPTDVLMTSSGEQLLREIPSLGKAYFELPIDSSQ